MSADGMSADSVVAGDPQESPRSAAMQGGLPRVLLGAADQLAIVRF